MTNPVPVDSRLNSSLGNRVNNNSLDSYLTVPYIDGGRDFDGFDCWGLVRHILHFNLHQPLLDSYGFISPDDKINLTAAYQKVAPLFVQCQPQSGCIVACFKRGLLLHVGVVVEANGLQVYHTGRKHGPLKTKLANFERLFFKVKYYAYHPGLSQQT